jgi:hypothetical protein
MPSAVAVFVNDTYETESYDQGGDAEFARIHITRTFSGDLEGTARAELLTVSAREGSAAYVALDAVSGRLGGREGSFVLEHHGIVSQAGADTAGVVVPDSGTGDLEGLTGTARIAVDPDGTHRLLLDYALPG